MQENTTDELELIRRYVATADESAAEALFRLHADRAFRVALRFCRNSADAEDAVQSAFFYVFRDAARFRAESGLRGWILKIVINVCRMKVRENSRRRTREETLSRPDAAESSPAEKNELADLAYSTAQKLPDPYRMPVLLHYVEGLSFSEISEALSIKEKTAREQARRGLEKLRRTLSPAGEAVTYTALSGALAAAATPAAPAGLIEAFPKIIRGDVRKPVTHSLRLRELRTWPATMALAAVFAGIAALACYWRAGRSSAGLQIRSAAADPQNSLVYVAVSGDDSNPGTEEKPFHTLQHAVDQAAPGSTILVRDGVYSTPLSITKSGMPRNPITIANAPGERPILDMGFSRPDAVQILSGHIHFSGFEIRNCKGVPQFPSAGAITIGAPAHDCEISNNIIHHILGYSPGPGEDEALMRSVPGILVLHAERITVRNNSIFEVVAEGEAMGIKVIGNDNRVCKNFVALCDKEGIRITAGDIPGSCTVEGNIAIFNHIGIAVISTWARQSILLRDNVCGWNWGSGVDCRHSLHAEIEHNTICENGANGVKISGGGSADLHKAANESLRIAHNIFSNNAGAAWRIASDAAINESIDFNLYSRSVITALGGPGSSQRVMNLEQLRNVPIASSYEGHGKQQDFQFQDERSGDLRLPSSISVDAGASPVACLNCGAGNSFGLDRVLGIRPIKLEVESFSSETASGRAAFAVDASEETYWEIDTTKDSEREIILRVLSAQPEELGFLTVAHYPGGLNSAAYDYKNFQIFVDDGSGKWLPQPSSKDHPFCGFHYKLGNGETWSFQPHVKARRIKIKIRDAYGANVRIPEIRLFSPFKLYSF